MAKSDVQFVAIPSSYEEEIEGNYKVVGQLKIINNSSSDVSFSNKDLYLVIEKEGESRTYVNSVASHAIDFSTTTIKKGGTLEQNVYWVLPAVSLRDETSHPQ